MSEQVKHTEGPWRVEAGTYFDPPHSPRLRIFGKNSREVCEVVYRTVHEPADSPEPNANANLIAATPDLLAACEAVLRMRIVCPEDAEQETEACRAAVAKAKGGSGK
jgi:hypothetical protein